MKITKKIVKRKKRLFEDKALFFKDYFSLFAIVMLKSKKKRLLS